VRGYLNARCWGWFAAWMVIGAGFAFGILGAASIGLAILLITIIGTVFLARRRASTCGVAGITSGLGIGPLYMAFINRSGPGDICSSTATSQTCVSEVSPWPWLLIGVILVIAGCLIFVIHQHRGSRLTSNG
jgi:hypothetical protein